MFVLVQGAVDALSPVDELSTCKASLVPARDEDFAGALTCVLGCPVLNPSTRGWSWAGAGGSVKYGACMQTCIRQCIHANRCRTRARARTRVWKHEL